MNLDLEFNRPRKAHSVGWMLLGLALILTAWMATAHRNLTAELKSLSKNLAGVGGPTDRPSTIGSRNSKDDEALVQEIRQASRIMDDLARPWDQLFEALESIEVDRVALLSIQPDSDRHLITLTGEAKEYADLLTYLVRLKNHKQFSSAALTNHELRESDPHRPYLFVAQATWKVVGR